jgi:multiple sugar transport system permease protein
VYVVVLAFLCFRSSGSLHHFQDRRGVPARAPSGFRNPTLASFEHVVKVGGLDALKNTLIISLSATALSLLVGSLAGYGLARYRTGGDNLPFFILSLRFMPAVAVIFPFLLLFRSLKWMDTYQAIIILHLTFNLPYAVWMMRSFFIEVPREIEESALVDGTSPFGAFWRVAMPLVTPGLIATGVFCFIFSWSEFFFALSLTYTKTVPLSVFLPNFFGKHDSMVQSALSRCWQCCRCSSSVSLCSATWCGLTMGAVK